MSRLKMVGGVFAGLGVLVLMGAGGGWMWASSAVDGIFDKSWETHEVDFAVPFPLSETELEALRAERLAEAAATDEEDPPSTETPDEADEAPDPLEGVDLEALALERAIARGDHYVHSIYACTSCHGSDLTGGKMLDDGAIGQVFGPNITPGGKTANYAIADWDRAVRHGVLPNGKTSIMPVLDFKNLTDRELSDIIAYIRSLPATEGGDTVRTWGPIGTMLIATGQLVPDTYKVGDHSAAHAVEPPPPTPDATYGEHVIAICTGCHRESLDGGPMPFGPPDWPPAGNLTPHESGLGGWTYEDFVAALRQGKRKNGEAMKVPMSELIPFANAMTETELKAMFAYLQSLDPVPMGE